MESKGDQHIHGERPAVGVDAESPYDGGKAEIDKVKIKDKGHAPVIREPYIAERRQHGHTGNPDDGDDRAEEEAEQDGCDDDFHRERKGRDQPGKYAYEKEGSKVSMESFLYKTSGTGRVTPLPFSACAGERRGSAPLSDGRRILSDVLLPQ